MHRWYVSALTLPIVALLTVSVARAVETLEQNPCGPDLLDQIELDVIIGGRPTGDHVLAGMYSYEYVFQGGEGIGREFHSKLEMVMVREDGTRRSVSFGNIPCWSSGRIEDCTRNGVILEGHIDRGSLTITVTGRKMESGMYPMKVWKDEYKLSPWRFDAQGWIELHDQDGTRCQSVFELRQRQERLALECTEMLPVDSVSWTSGGFCPSALGRSVPASASEYEKDIQILDIRGYLLDIVADGKPTGQVLSLDLVIIGAPVNEARIAGTYVCQEDSREKVYVGPVDIRGAQLLKWESDQLELSFWLGFFVQQVVLKGSAKLMADGKGRVELKGDTARKGGLHFEPLVEPLSLRYTELAPYIRCDRAIRLGTR